MTVDASLAARGDELLLFDICSGIGGMTLAALLGAHLAQVQTYRPCYRPCI